MYSFSGRTILVTGSTRGIGRESERLPHWITEEPREDTGWTLPQSELDYMLTDYYRIRGWGELPAAEPEVIGSALR